MTTSAGSNQRVAGNLRRSGSRGAAPRSWRVWGCRGASRPWRVRGVHGSRPPHHLTRSVLARHGQDVGDEEGRRRSKSALHSASRSRIWRGRRREGRDGFIQGRVFGSGVNQPARADALLLSWPPELRGGTCACASGERRPAVSARAHSAWPRRRCHGARRAGVGSFGHRCSTRQRGVDAAVRVLEHTGAGAGLSGCAGGRWPSLMSRPARVEARMAG